MQKYAGLFMDITRALKSKGSAVTRAFVEGVADSIDDGDVKCLDKEQQLFLQFSDGSDASVEVDPQLPASLMKEVLFRILRGWTIYNASWDGQRHTKDDVTAMTEACDGDADAGFMLHLFSEQWANDISDMAERVYGLTWNKTHTNTGQQG